MLSNEGGMPFTMPVQPANSYGNSGGWDFGGDGVWFIILFLIFAMFGWGGYGFGNNGGGGATSGYVLTSDFANIERKLDGINNGICDSTFALNNSIKDGFSQAEIARCNAQMAFMQQFFALQQQLSDCCCQNREAIAQVRYDMATQNCATGNLIQNSTRDIIDAMNCGLRGITAALTINGEPLTSATATVTPAAAENYFNIFVAADVDVPKGGCVTVAMRNTSTQAISFANSNMIAVRTC